MLTVAFLIHCFGEKANYQTEELTLAGHALEVKAIIGAKLNKQPPLGHTLNLWHIINLITLAGC